MRRRTAGTGGVYQPTYRGPDGKLRTSAIWWMRYTAAGEEIRESTGARSRRAAENALRERLVARDAGAPLGRAARETTLATLRQLVEADYAAQGRRTSVRQRFAHLEAHLGGGSPAAELSEAVATDYIAARRAEGAAVATVNRELAALKRGLRLAARARLISRRPDIPLLRESNARQGFLEEAHLEAILVHLAEHLRPVVRAARITGWRIASELLTRQWRHVDLVAGWLRLEPGEGKTGEGRMFPLTGELRTLLEAQREATTAIEREGRICPWVFHHAGVTISRGELRRAWQRARRAAGRPGALLHDLRRTAVRALERAGVPRSAAMAMVGHKTESMYRRYAIVDEALLREAIRKVDAK
jgi:integrase